MLEAAALADPARLGDRGTGTSRGRRTRAPLPRRGLHVVHSSLVIHHLEPDEARALLAEMARVARHGVVVNDLVRGRAAWAGAWALSHLATRNRYTRHDAPLSVRRAYSVAELTALLAAAGIRVERRFDGPFGHRVALAGRRNGHG